MQLTSPRTELFALPEWPETFRNEYLRQGLWSDETFDQRIKQVCKIYGNQIAICYESIDITYRQLYLRACKIAQRFYDLNIMPFMTSEWLRLSYSEKIPNLSWYNLFSSDELRQWLTKKEHRHVDAANDLVALSINVFAGQSEQHVLAVEAQGNSGGREHHCAWLITCSSGSSLTAAVIAYAAQQILLSTIPKGLYFAADVLSPEGTIEFIQQNLGTCCWIKLPSLFSNEEGAL